MSTRSRNLRLTLVCAAAAGCVLAGAVGCQTYDFEPVDPLAISQRTKTQPIAAHSLKPDLYLLVDRSGSMNGPTDPTVPACSNTPDGGVCGPPPNGAGPCDPSTCPTRWSEMQNAMGQFLTNSGTVARMGLSFFPESGGIGCTASNAVDVPLDGSNDDPASLQSTADSIRASIDAKTPGGGTPTSASLSFVGTTYASAGTGTRQNFVLLLTDGLPNCNSSLDKDTCTCTEANPASCTSYIDGSLCLDDTGTVDEISSLAANNIKTIVVGFGADTASGSAPQVLTAMANAGGFPKTCPDGTDAECGTGDTCNTTTKLCGRPFYQAANGAELAAALAKISQSIVVGDPCIFTLDTAPSDPSLLSVLVNGQETPPGPDTWKYDTANGPEIVFQGAMCTAFKNSTTADPYTVQVQVVQAL